MRRRAVTGRRAPDAAPHLTCHQRTPPHSHSHSHSSLRHPPLLQSLSKLLGDNAPTCRKDQKFENYFGRKIAVDASMHIYQFMVREEGIGEEDVGARSGGPGKRLLFRPGRDRVRPALPGSAAAHQDHADLTLPAYPRHFVQVVVGRIGDQQLTDETGEVTR
jgi:hypothetical protein